jgi:hypothetical protein
VRRTAAVVLLTLAAASPLRADDGARQEQTPLIGSGEVPKVLYIVPWKRPLPGELVGRPVQSLLDEALAPVDPYAFRRQVRYQDLVERSEAAAGGK